MHDLFPLKVNFATATYVMLVLFSFEEYLSILRTRLEQVEAKYRLESLKLEKHSEMKLHPEISSSDLENLNKWKLNTLLNQEMKSGKITTKNG